MESTAKVLIFGRKSVDQPDASTMPAHRRAQNTYRAMLQDTLDLLGRIEYADENSRAAAIIQADAIEELLAA